MILLFIFISLWLGLSLRYCWYIFALLFIGFIIFIFIKYTKKLAIICLAVGAIGIGVSFVHIEHSKESYTGIVYEVKDNYFLFNSNGERLYLYEKNNTREIGDILKISGTKEDITFARLESSFDFADYLNKRGVHHELHYSKIEVKFSAFLKLNAAKKSFLSKFNEESASVISSILFSQSGSSEVVNSVRNLHLAKFLSANGTYIYLILWLISKGLSKIFDKKWADLGALGIALVYLIFVFPKFSAIRISFLYLVRWINKYLFKGRFKYFTVISFSGLFFLTLNPYLAYQDSFILGYIVPIVFYFSREASKDRGRIMRNIWPSIFMYFFFIPFELEFYNSVSPFSMILQLVFTPLFIIIGISSLLCFLRVPIYGVASFFVSFLKGATSFINPINVSFYAKPMNPVLILVYYAIFLVFLYYFKIRFIPINKWLTVGYIGLMFFYLAPINNFLSSQVTFINVGQGDSCLIRDKNTTILIDTGGLTYTDVAEECLIPFFKKNKIYKIDLVITTHDDNDHCGALPSLQKHFKVKNYINTASSFPVKIGDVVIQNYNNHIGESDDENNNSLVLGFELMKKNFLIMGDAPIEIEKKIISEYPNIDCDILKVGHHGSDTSSCKQFLEFVSPEEAIISVGENNRYGHPTQSVLNMLKNLGISIKRTDYLGSITYKSYIWNNI